MNAVEAALFGDSPECPHVSLVALNTSQMSSGKCTPATKSSVAPTAGDPTPAQGDLSPVMITSEKTTLVSSH